VVRFWSQDINGCWTERDIPDQSIAVAERESTASAALVEPDPLQEPAPAQTKPVRISPAPQQGTGLGLVDFAEQVLGLKLYPRQAEILAEYEQALIAELILCLGRRSGKTLLAAVIALYNALVESYDGFLRPGEQALRGDGCDLARASENRTTDDARAHPEQPHAGPVAGG
jgi:hypothetical protein